jgi:hypothetical protein
MWGPSVWSWWITYMGVTRGSHVRVQEYPVYFGFWVQKSGWGGVDQLFAPKPHFCRELPIWYKKLKKIWRSDWCLDEHFTHIMFGQAIITSAGTKN